MSPGQSDKGASAPFLIRPYGEEDLAGILRAWNGVVEAGNAFPQTDPLNEDRAREFFASQSHCGVAVRAAADADGAVAAEAAATSAVLGMYILHPNNVGRCGHVANASYAVVPEARGCGIGRALVEDSLAQAAALGFRGLQFNAVVASNEGAIHLYESLGFKRVGTVPEGFLNGRGVYEDIHVFYRGAD